MSSLLNGDIGVDTAAHVHSSSHQGIKEMPKLEWIEIAKSCCNWIAIFSS